MPASGTATPYPSQLAVEHPGAVVDVNVSLSLSHTRPDDLDLLLVGPQGQAVVLMSDAGGANAVEDSGSTSTTSTTSRSPTTTR